MGTRSRIAVMHGTVCKSVYCHWDGYLAHNGAILQEHYDSSKANQLVALGDLSSLRANIGEKHAFSQFELPKEEVEAFKTLTENWCTFYGRDRGEQGVEWKVSHAFEQFLEQCENCDAEYYYVMENGQWYCGSMHENSPFYKRLVLLSEALATEAVEA
jgi:hypothetical protein